jgi:hypothetical protein
MDCEKCNGLGVVLAHNDQIKGYVKMKGYVIEKCDACGEYRTDEAAGDFFWAYVARLQTLCPIKYKKVAYEVKKEEFARKSLKD